MKVSGFVLSLVMVTFVIMSLGGWYHGGASSYNMVNYTDFRSFNRSSALFDNFESETSTLLGNGSEMTFGEQFGFYITSVGSVFWSFIKGDYVKYATYYAGDLLGATELPIPGYVFKTIGIVLTLLIVFAAINIIMGGSKPI